MTVYKAAPLKKDEFGFFFWLRWIFWFALSFVMAAVFWTFLIKGLFGEIRGPEITITWALSVFGSWFLLVVPFMRKKEQIWKRLNDDEEKALSAWFKGMGLFIGLLIGTALFWGVHYKSQILTPETSRSLNVSWANAVFSSWLLLILPFLIFMYKKADRLFKSAVARQTAKGPVFKTCFVKREERLLPEIFANKLKSEIPALADGHVVRVRLKKGGEVPHVFVLKAKEILGVYDQNELGFRMDEIEDVDAMKPEELLAYEEGKWLRLDGRA